MAQKPEADPVIRTSLTLRRSLWRAVEAFRADAGLVTTAEAVRVLLREALEARAEQPVPPAKRKRR